MRFEAGKVHERAAELARLKPQPLQITRAWKDEHVYIGVQDATFIGLAAEHEIGNDSHDNREYDGWCMVTWTRDGSTWKVAHRSWQRYRSTLDFQRDYWNDNFRQDVGFSHEPNQVLVTTTAGTTLGAVLDLATGQGRNPLYLASHAWMVTTVDISDEGLHRAREAAARAHVALDTVQADSTMATAASSPASCERSSPTASTSYATRSSRTTCRDPRSLRLASHLRLRRRRRV